MSAITEFRDRRQLGLLLSGLHDQWLWFWLPISYTLGRLVVLWVQARQLERVNLATLDGQ